MKNISPRFRTTNLAVAIHLSSPLHHQLMSFTELSFILSISFLRGQDEKQIFQDLNYRHTRSETGVRVSFRIRFVYVRDSDHRLTRNVISVFTPDRQLLTLQTSFF